MKSFRRVLTYVLIVTLTTASLGLSACFSPAKEGGLTLREPTVAPPVINREGVLRVGVDYTQAPFAGTQNGKTVGIDADIASAIADAMGLRLVFVETAGQDVNAMLRDGLIDVAMGIQDDPNKPFTEVKVGPYLVDGPAIFAVGLSTSQIPFDPERLNGVRIAAQENSKSAYLVTVRYGEENILTFPLLSTAFDELSNGTYSYVAAGAIVGSFLAVKMDNVRCEGLLGEIQGVYMGVASDKSELATELTKVLRTLRDDGTLMLIISKWLGPQSAQVVASDQAIISIANPENPGGEAAPAQ